MNTVNQSFSSNLPLNKIFVGVLIGSVVLGLVTGFLLSHSSNSAAKNLIQSTGVAGSPAAKTPSQDNGTFRDFAEGVIQKKVVAKNSNGDYSEGTHVLVRQNAVPVALTSSVVDLSQYEGKKVKVFGETQKALREGWLMDVGKVEVQP